MERGEEPLYSFYTNKEILSKTCYNTNTGGIIMNIDVIIHKEDNGYWAEVPALKGCYSQGDTIDELKKNIREAI